MTSGSQHLNFSEQDRKLIVLLTSRLTGASPQAHQKLEAGLVNIRRRMEATGAEALDEYLKIVEGSVEELAYFISAVTIHTTSWFRERPHFERLHQLASSALEAFTAGKRKDPFRILSAGCSTGEEAYSIALVLEDLRLANPEFDYIIEGWDVDLISVAKAAQAIYSTNGLRDIAPQLQKYLLVGSGPTQGYFTFDQTIRQRCNFLRRSLVSAARNAAPPFDVIFCRNVLIYFSMDAVRDIISGLTALLKPGAHLILGHSESIDAITFDLTPLGNTTYRKGILDSPAASTPSTGRQTKSNVDKRPDIILIGASTGGTEVLVKLLQAMPQPCPPVLIVQHISVSFAIPFAERLAHASGLDLARPDPGAVLQPNHLYMALGDYHIAIKWRGGLCLFDTTYQPPIHSVRPAVDVLFHSATDTARHLHIAAMILTGMGKDGASGLLALRQRGATTYVQDESSSTVFGMPREAIALGAAGFIGNPTSIRQRLLQSLKARGPKVA